MVPIMEIDPSIYNGSVNSSTSFLWSTGDTSETITVTPTETTEYWVDVTTNGFTCRETIIINVNDVPEAPISAGDITECGDIPLQTLEPFASVNAGEELVWYDAPIGGNIIDAPLLSNIGAITYYAEALNAETGCRSLERTPVQLQLLENVIYNPPINLIECDDSSNDGVSNFDLSIQTNHIDESASSELLVTYYYTSIDAELEDNVIATNSIISGNTTIYARVENSMSGCFAILPFDLIVEPYPSIDILDAYILCNSESIVLSPGNTFVDYLWSTGETTSSINVSEPGNYQVDVLAQNGCRAEFTYNVLSSSSATINDINVVIDGVNQNTVFVDVTGDGEYQFSVNGFDFQDSSSFINLAPGSYTVYVRDTKGCGTVTQEISIIGVPLFFTPNQDGFNDYWQVIESKSIPLAKIFIYDRYGKLLIQLSPNSIGWDGNYNGHRMPSNDYWYRIELESGKVLNGHFTLKR
jgi:gliding motility-associated-like protein